MAYFWKKWKNVNVIEKKAIASVEKALKILFENVSERKIRSIYIKGSFVRREMNRKSDVDIVPITFHNNALQKIKDIQDNLGDSFAPAEFVPHSLNEFKTGKRFLKYKSLKGTIDITLRELYKAELVFGKPLDVSAFPMRTDKRFLRGHMNAFKEIFIPLFEKGELGFSSLIKQVFFLVEKAERLEGNILPLKWKEAVEGFSQDHIICDAYKNRMKKTKDDSERKKFVDKLKVYIAELDRKYFAC